MAYSEITKILPKITVVKTVGKLLADFVCTNTQRDNCGDFASQRVAIFLFPFVFSHQCLLLKHVQCFKGSQLNLHDYIPFILMYTALVSSEDCTPRRTYISTILYCSGYRVHHLKQTFCAFPCHGAGTMQGCKHNSVQKFLIS